MKNITLSLHDQKLDDLRHFAQKDATTVNVLFRSWVDEYVQNRRKTESQRLLKAFKDSHQYLSFTSERKYTREEMNER